MKILSFDTSGEFCSVALHVGKDLIAFDQDITCSLQAAELLIPMIDKVVKSSFLRYKDLDYVALTKGPGSFTGIRVGLSAAQGILMCTKASPVVFSNFELWNYRSKMQMGSGLDASVVVIKAYSGQIYTQVFEYCGDNKNPELLTLEQLKKNIEYLADKTVAFLGTGITYLVDPFFQRPNFFFFTKIYKCKVFRAASMQTQYLI